MIAPQALRVYLIFDPTDATLGPEEMVDAVVAGGVTAVQLRWKGATDREIVQVGRKIAPRLNRAGIPFLINDRIDVAMAIGADGVHLGVDDLPLADARRLGGPDFIIGFSPETDEQIADASAKASYLGIGPFYATQTKLDAGEELGDREFGRRRSLTPLPVVAIGGITADTASNVMQAGADGVAVASAILRAADPRSATRRIRVAVDGHAT